MYTEKEDAFIGVLLLIIIIIGIIGGLALGAGLSAPSETANGEAHWTVASTIATGGVWLATAMVVVYFNLKRTSVIILDEIYTLLSNKDNIPEETEE